MKNKKNDVYINKDVVFPVVIVCCVILLFIYSSIYNPIYDLRDVVYLETYNCQEIYDVIFMSPSEESEVFNQAFRNYKNSCYGRYAYLNESFKGVEV